MDPIAININFDSLNEAFGFPDGFRDPSFFAAFDRLSAAAERRGMRLSLYIIGRDLDNSEIAARVRDWHAAGHEIGNHTWSHPYDLGALPPARLDAEIRRAHDRIAETIGTEPRGFIAPNWCTSGRVLGTLIDLGYLYDTSVFPSLMLWPMVAKAAINHRRDKVKSRRLLSRRDWLLQPRLGSHPFIADRHYRRVDRPGPGTIVVLPLPTERPWRLPLWHTVGLVLDWTRYLSDVRRAVGRPGFYHLMHPADFTGLEDLEQVPTHSLERLAVPVRDKMDRIEQVLDLLLESGRPVATMSAVARAVLAQAEGGATP
ncbi:MAG: polysaccharide deacetylase family protein [Alphaproteobacteria bacterium]|nr:polysaccharide deacetylase family protein [Alphaproteobacteria bacterium]